MYQVSRAADKDLNALNFLEERRERVSSPEENLILVDENDHELGGMSKFDCHQGDGVLHRAFSIFIFNSVDELILQQRSSVKPLWPLYWSNTCCSHPRTGESMEVATSRRLKEEIGINCLMSYLYKFEYQANYKDIGAERELCSVFVGRSDGPFDPNMEELAAMRSIGIDELSAELENNPSDYTPWFKMEWAVIRSKINECGGSVTQFLAEIKSSNEVRQLKESV